MSADFNTTPNAASALSSSDSAVSAVSASAAAAASLIHSASQINDLSGFSSLAQVCQYGGQFSQLTQDPTASLYGAAAAVASSGLEVTPTSATTPSVSTAASVTVTPPGGIASFGFTQEQVACVCEVLEQSGNIDRLAR